MVTQAQHCVSQKATALRVNTDQCLEAASVASEACTSRFGTGPSMAEDLQAHLLIVGSLSNSAHALLHNGQANTLSKLVWHAGATAGGLSINSTEYPNVTRSEFSEVLHGREVPDPYRWLEEPDSDDTKSCAFTESFLCALKHAAQLGLHCDLRPVTSVGDLASIQACSH